MIKQPFHSVFEKALDLRACGGKSMFSAFYGWWNEQLTSHKAFVTALKRLVRANVEAMMAILPVRGDALFIQGESSEYTHAAHPDLLDEAEMLNERRFLSLDLNYAKRVSSGMYQCLLDNGMTRRRVRLLSGSQSP